MIEEKRFSDEECNSASNKNGNSVAFVGILNCHGCKWLDRYKIDGNGYCCMVERSKTQKDKVRRPEMERCELYKAGDWKTRWETEREKKER